MGLGLGKGVKVRVRVRVRDVAERVQGWNLNDFSRSFATYRNGKKTIKKNRKKIIKKCRQIFLKKIL